ncbi:MAG: gliding motility-associated C-terminal domain-containing protein [Bacteroidales bacterium]|nr:gliding motility-associated C-terminal domain-containing protein [Bacteroidales bacterium]
MKKTIILSLLTILTLLPLCINAQSFLLSESQNGTTIYSCDGFIYDDGGPTGNYTSGTNLWRTICPSQPNSRISLTFNAFNIDASDKVKLYSGKDTTAQFFVTNANIPYFNDTYLLGETVTAFTNDTSGCITVQLTSNNSAQGFAAQISCVPYCQTPMSRLDTFFYKFMPDGSKVQFPVKDCIDTLWAADSINYSIVKYQAIDICFGDSVELVAKTSFPENDINYHQSDSACIFYWNFFDGENSLDTVYFNTTTTYKWTSMRGYDLGITVYDTNNGGCFSKNVLGARVRPAQNPVKFVDVIPDMCSGESFLYTVGYGPNNSIKLDSIHPDIGEKQRTDSIVFIPDGDDCPPGYFEVPVTFDKFPTGAVLQSLDEFVSICMNLEHSYIGDLVFELICPNGQGVTLKYQSGGGVFLGVPIDTDQGCDPNNPQNAPGVGWTYCFSNQYLNGARGILGNTAFVHSGIADSTNTTDTIGYYQTPLQNAPQGSYDQIDLNGFQPLVGCPLNGQWILKLTDNYGIDNGWVFWWDLELQTAGATDWEYQVGMKEMYLDGPFATNRSNTEIDINPPIDTSGNFRYPIRLIDEWGCVWDTATSLNVVKTPVVDLGDDIAVCEGFGTRLDAGNPDASEYIWEPGGETTQTIMAMSSENSDSRLTYVAQVVNKNNRLACYGTDSIDLIVHPAALAAFNMSQPHLEGCEPLEFQLMSRSTNADITEWTVGQFKSNEVEPSFSFPYGTYDLKLKVTSEFGCVDSIIQTNFIHVYKSPTADFGWQPINPSVGNPVVNFINLTTPNDPINQYHWKIQGTKMNDLRENVFGFEPSYRWMPVPGYNVAGDYNVTLDAYSVNIAPSGNKYECHDTISKIISIINDRLIAPTVVTPNGDGINDVFILKNLVEGQAYPDNELTIYNRNGKRIYFRQDIRSDEEAWDPAKTNTPAGTYFFKFVGRGITRNVEFNGVIEVIK